MGPSEYTLHHIFSIGLFYKTFKFLLSLTFHFHKGGAGKSTLMDILTGYTTNLASGTITINGKHRDLKRFRSQAAYIMQDDLLQMHITVYEAMFFSVNLKIGSQLKRNEKEQRVSQPHT